MAEVRELAKKKSAGNKESGNNFKNTDIYPFWKMKENEEAVIRFLPDKNEEERPLPFISKQEHKLAINGKNRKIPCPQTFGNKCPICDVSQEYYRAEGKGSKNGKYYWRDMMHLARAVVISDPLPPDDETGETFEGKVVTLQLGFQIHEKIMAQIGDFFDDDDPLPWDLEKGFNFKIKKTKQGDYMKYDLASTFERKPSEIPTDYLENIKLIDLETLLPEEVDYDKANEFLENHLSGGVDDSDDDSLDSKRSGGDSETSSKRSEMLKRLQGEEDEEELDEDMKSIVEDAKQEDSDSSSDSEDQSDDDSDDDDEDDDEDDDDELKAIIRRRRSKK